MKSIISDIASKHPNLSDPDFNELYRSQHPRAETLGPDNLRSAYQTYKAVIRKQKRRSAGIIKDGHHRDHHPAKLGGSL